MTEENFRAALPASAKPPAVGTDPVEGPKIGEAVKDMKDGKADFVIVSISGSHSRGRVSTKLW